MKRQLRQTTKKEKLIRMLKEHDGAVPINLATKELYGRCGREEKEKVIRLLSAFRANKTLQARVRKNHVVWA